MITSAYSLQTTIFGETIDKEHENGGIYYNVLNIRWNAKGL